MKKLSKIFAVVLVLAMVLSVLPLGAAAAAETVTYDFSTVNAKSNEAISATVAKEVFDAAASGAGLTGVTTATKIYKGSDNTSGAFPNATDCLKTGTSGTAGKLVLTFNKNVSKVEIACHAWTTSGSDKVSVNGVEMAAPKTGNKTTALTFDLATASDTITIDFNKRVFVFKITVTFGEAASGGSTPTPTPTPTPTAKEGTIAQALAGASGELWKTTGAVTYVNGKDLYIQDASGAIAVRLTADATDLVVGDNITVEGTLGAYSKLPQLNVENANVTKVATTITVTPKAATVSELTKADLCKVVKLTNVTITEYFDNNGQYTNPNITVTDGTTTIQIYRAVAPAGLAVGDKIDVVAVLSCYNDTLQLRNDDAADITKAVADTDDNNDTNNDNNNDNNNSEVEPPKQTGDNTAIVAMTSVMAIAVVALAVLVIGKKRMF